MEETIITKIILLYSKKDTMENAEATKELHSGGMSTGNIMAEIADAVADATECLAADTGTEMASVWQNQIDALNWASNILLATKRDDRG